MTPTEFLREAQGLARAVWQRRWLAAGVAWGVAVVLAAVIWFVPNRYEASAKLFVDTQSVLKPLMAGLAFQPDLDQQVRMLAKTVLSRPNLERLLEDPVVRGDRVEPVRREQAIDALGLKIKIEHSGGNLFAITYRDPDPARAQAVVSGLINLFVHSGIDNKQRDSQEASRFIDSQIQQYEAKLIESENRLKDFKLRNFGLSGVSNQDYFARTSALTDEVNRLQVALNAAEQSREALKRELAAEEPQLPPEMGAAQPAPMPVESDARMDALRRQLDELLRRYTDEHPDVIAVRRSLAQLESQKRAEMEARVKAAGGRPGARVVAGNNPVYQRLRIALAEAESNIASLRTQLQANQARLEQTRSLASKVPQAEAELAQLNRDYDIMRRQYDQLVARREAASLGVKIDQSSQMAEFRIVEPPRVSPRAVFPDRVALALLAALVALAGGLAVAFGVSRLAPTIDGMDALRAISGRPVLGSVAVYHSPRALARVKQDRLLLIGASLLFLAAQAAWIVTLAGRGFK